MNNKKFMHNKWSITLKKIVFNPYLNLIVGILFLYSGMSEAIEEFEHIGELKFHVHHGVIIFSLLHILKTIPDLFEGLEYFGKGEGMEEGSMQEPDAVLSASQSPFDP